MSSEAPGSGRAAASGGHASSPPKAGAIILVHGTWAPRAAWVEGGSLLAQALRKSSRGAAIRAFRWSGRNAHSARIGAGSELASFLLELHRECGLRDFQLIGHSHGGNVILYALRDPQVAPLVRRLAFLGTPFIATGRRDAHDIADQAGGLFAWLLVAPILAALAWVAVASGLLPMAVVAPAAFAMLILVGNSPAFGGFKENIIRSIHAGLRRRQDHFAAEISTPVPGVPCFVAYVAGDEALLHLTSVELLSDIQWRSIEALRSAVPAAGLVFVWGSLIILIGGWPTPLDQPGPFALMLPLLVGATVVAPLVVTVFSRLTRGSSIGFGGEGLIASATLRTKPLRLPPWPLPPESRIHAWQRPPAASGLRHSGLYADGRIAEDLCRWLHGDCGSAGAADPEQGAVRPLRRIVRRPAFSWRWGLFGALAMSIGLVWSTVRAEREIAAAIAETDRMYPPERR